MDIVLDDFGLEWKRKDGIVHKADYDDLIDSHEKQMPKKILRGTVARDTACYCPNCKEFVCFEDTEKHNYCSNCGQKLDW